MKAIITGSTGMIGKALLLECLEDSNVDKVLVINRNTLNMQHQKLHEALVEDFSNIASMKDELAGYDVCFHCMGTSALGKTEEQYSRITFDYTRILTDAFYEMNPNAVFVYVSGSGTDSSEKGNIMWARVKGRTENYILQKGFRDAYMFRPGGILPEKGIKSRTGWYNTIYTITKPLFPLLKKFNSITTSTKLATAMIKSALKPHDAKILENPEINRVAAM